MYSTQGNKKMVELLIKTGVNVNDIDHLGKTVLHTACRDGIVRSINLKK